MAAALRQLTLCAGLLLLLAGCAIHDYTPPPPTPIQPVLMTPTALTLKFEGSCEEDPEIFEEWLKSTTAALQNLTRLMQDAPSRTPTQVTEDLRIVLVMRTGVASLAAPDCSEQTHVLLMQLLDMTVVWMQAYAGGQAADLSEDAAAINQLSEHVSELHTYLLESFDPAGTEPQDE